MMVFSDTEKEGRGQFGRVAEVYDRLMRGIPYSMWISYVKAIWLGRGKNPDSILDVACGTGNVAFRLADQGYKVVGIDYSAPMIRHALLKLGNAGNPVFYCQDAAEIDLNTNFDAAISLFDSLNYITDADRLMDAFISVERHLQPGGIFIFDMNTRYALSHKFFDQDNLDTNDYPQYNWTSDWDEQSKTCRISMEFSDWIDGKLETFHETHIQRAYSNLEIREGLQQAGFSNIEFLRAYTHRPPAGKTDRIYVISEKP